MDIKPIAGAGLFKWDNDYLFQVLTTGHDPILTDPKIIAAFRNVDRKDFVPIQIREQAYIDKELDIGYNEKFTRPTVIAQMINLMKPVYGGKYLDIGSGTGYVAVLLAMIAGDEGMVFSIERIRWLWDFARENTNKYKDKAPRLQLLYRDGMQGLQNQAPFDAIHVAFAMQEIPKALKEQLKPEGRLVCPTTNMDLRVVTRKGVEEFEEEIIPGVVFEQGKAGIA